ncbi:hypothetical protein QJQ45_000802 [Haematococcus lacustris]|nr:hypothetical protein QJQ45_000802 [Haematococcus lacustris]
MAKDPGKKQKVSRSPQGKQRQERRDGWTTRRRQVIKVPEGAVLRGCNKTRRKLREHLRLRAQIHSQLRVIASLLVLKFFLTDAEAAERLCKFFANPSFKTVYNQLQRRLVRHRQPMLMPAWEDPSNQALLAKLQELGSINLAGDANTIGAHSMQLAVAMQQHYSNPGKSL